MGKRLVKQLGEDSHYRVHSLDLTIPPETARNHNVYAYIQTDITNKEHVTKALKGMDVVFHTASLIPVTVEITDDDMQRVNVDGTRNIIEACKENKVKRLIYTSSSCVGMSKDPNKVCEKFSEDQSLPDDPLNTYVQTKGVAETMVVKSNKEGGLHTCVLRLAGLLGGTDSKLMRSFMAVCVVQFSSAEARISWIGVKAAANAHIMADQKLSEELSNTDNQSGHSEGQIAGRIFNISIKETFKLCELYTFFAEENGRPLIVIPLWLVKSLVSVNVYTYQKTGIIPLYAYLTPACFEFLLNPFNVTTERARKELGWEESRPWKEVIRELIHEYRAESQRNKKTKSSRPEHKLK